VQGRTPLVKDREGGAFYQRSWETLLKLNPIRRPKLVMVETWTEFHEGTDIADSVEFGRQYIDLTATYARRFHDGARIEAPGGKHTGAKGVWGTFGVEGQDNGVRVVPCADGTLGNAAEGGRSWVQSAPNEFKARYLYFDVDDSFAFDLDPGPVTVVIEYLDKGASGFTLEYDSADPAGSVRAGAFKAGGGATTAGTGAWKTATFTLPDARFANRTNGSDMRLAVGPGGELGVCRVEVRKGS
jgi:hypothetical protein